MMSLLLMLLLMILLLLFCCRRHCLHCCCCCVDLELDKIEIQHNIAKGRVDLLDSKRLGILEVQKETRRKVRSLETRNSKEVSHPQQIMKSLRMCFCLFVCLFVYNVQLEELEELHGQSTRAMEQDQRDMMKAKRNKEDMEQDIDTLKENIVRT